MNFKRLLKNWKRVVLPSSFRDWWLERQINTEFEAKIKEAREKEDQNEANRLAYERRWNLAEIRDSRQARIQDKWIRKARKFMIPIPSQVFAENKAENDDWEFSAPSGEMLLKPHAMVNLRREVRREQKEWREAFGYWITFLIALLGAVSGLVSVLMR